MANKLPQRPIVDLNQISRSLDAPPPISDPYAPPMRRIEELVQIPVKDIEEATRELDEILRAAQDEVKELERKVIVVRNLYHDHTKRIKDDIKRLRDGIALSMKTMITLREQCLALDVDRIVEDAERPDVLGADNAPLHSTTQKVDR